MKQRDISLEWKVGHCSGVEERPESWVSAKVPGAVQLDMLEGFDDKDWHFADNVRQFDWMEDKYWMYETSFEKPQYSDTENVFFVTKGIDYQYQILLNGEKIHEHEGMFTRFELNITDGLKDDNVLQVVVFPAPKSREEPSRFQADQCAKPAVSYGWDWHPRLIPLGIWEETGLVIKSKNAIAHLDYYYDLNDDLTNAQIELSGLCGQGAKEFRFKVNDKEGVEVLNVNEAIEGDKIAWIGNFAPKNLWWPYELGDPYLYNCSLELIDEQGEKVDEKKWKWGFRRSKLVMNKGAWVEPVQFPKSRSVAPITLEINGQVLFAKGSNWVNPEVFPGAITDERYRELLELAKRAHFNILRIWGGSIVNKDYFHEWCDENGMMVWQEFPLSCCNYRDSKSYLDTLEKEARSIVKRLRSNPSTIMWCGGNELFNNWSGMTDQNKALRLLNSICLELDENTPFIATSPLFGMGHGHYLFFDQGTGEDVFELMYRSDNTAYTEFGMPSPSSMNTLKSIIPENELKLPIEATPAWETHHAVKAWVDDAWICADVIQKYFPDTKELSDLVENGQKLQAIGYRAIYEMARQQWPYCSMALNWCFNEPWPSAANNSIIQFDGTVKPCYEAIKLACRPVMASARFRQFEWMKGEELSFELYFFNHSLDGVTSEEVKVYINGVLQLIWPIHQLGSYENAIGPMVKYQILDDYQEVTIELKTINSDWNSSYTVPLIESTKDEGVLNM